jgi:hypothetical protein
MSSRTVDLFVEDVAHETFVGAIVRRIARDLKASVRVTTRSARGGHPRVMEELAAYQKTVLRGGMMSVPDMLVVAIDTNCQGLIRKKAEIAKRLKPAFKTRTVIAAADPHIERWYLADSNAFQQVVGVQPRRERRKCERGRYKRLLRESIERAGVRPLLGGIEYGRELADAMDFYQAGKLEPSLRQFVADARAMLKHDRP